MPNINTIDMVDVATTFQDSVSHVLSNLVLESRQNIKHYIATIVLLEKPYILVGKEGIQRAIELVFLKEEYRDFIFTLHYTFFSRWGNDVNMFNGLIGNLARGIALSNLSTNSIMPKDINYRLTTEELANDILLANTWLVIVILLQLFINVDTISIGMSKDSADGY